MDYPYISYYSPIYNHLLSTSAIIDKLAEGYLLSACASASYCFYLLLEVFAHFDLLDRAYSDVLDV